MSNEPIAAANKSESIMFLLILKEAARRCLVIDIVLFFIVTFEHISHLFPAFLLLTLNKSLLAEMVKKIVALKQPTYYFCYHWLKVKYFVDLFCRIYIYVGNYLLPRYAF